MDGILISIKKMLGIESDYNHFDTDIIININSALVVVNQLGIGPPNGFAISGDTETWTDILGEGVNLNAVKTYIYLRVKLVFDTPSSSFVVDAMKDQIKEFEWRLNVQSENNTHI